MRSGHFVKYSREKNIDSKFFKCLVNNYGYYNKNYNAIDKLVLYLAFIWKERCNICSGVTVCLTMYESSAFMYSNM